MDAIARLLSERPLPPQRNHLSTLVDALTNPAPSPVRNPFVSTSPSLPANTLFGGGLGGALPSTSNYLNQLLKGLEQPPRPAPLPPLRTATARNVFYSFHFADIFRVNHVRNSGKIRPADKGRYLTPQDRSLWERVKRTNPANLRRVIDSGLLGTSVTCVLVGAETWAREWVRYEIARSLGSVDIRDFQGIGSVIQASGWIGGQHGWIEQS